MVVPYYAMGLWSWWLLLSETILMAHEVIGYAPSPDAITMTAPASRQCGAMACCKQWNYLFSIGGPDGSLNVPIILSAGCGENLRSICKKFLRGRFGDFSV